ncbi:MAG: hypothetical protein WB780_10530 [Candidatus Acidiferrales bacterium]
MDRLERNPKPFDGKTAKFVAGDPTNNGEIGQMNLLRCVLLHLIPGLWVLLTYLAIAVARLASALSIAEHVRDLVADILG